VEFFGPKGSVTIRMAFDTGATTTFIPPDVAIAIGCDPAKATRRYPMITASSIEYAPALHIPRVACLGKSVEALEVVCHRLPAESIVQGLLGLDFLRQVPVFQEFEKKILELTQP